MVGGSGVGICRARGGILGKGALEKVGVYKLHVYITLLHSIERR